MLTVSILNRFTPYSGVHLDSKFTVFSMCCDRAPSLLLFSYLSIGVLKAVENVNKVIGPALIAKVILIAYMWACWMISKVVCCFL